MEDVQSFDGASDRLLETLEHAELPRELAVSLHRERRLVGVDPADLPPDEAPDEDPPPLDIGRLAAGLAPGGSTGLQTASRTMRELRERTAERQAAARRLREEMASLREQAALLSGGAVPPAPPESNDAPLSSDHDAEFEEHGPDQETAENAGIDRRNRRRGRQRRN